MKKPKATLSSFSQFSQLNKLIPLFVLILLLSIFIFLKSEPMPGTVKTPLYHWKRVVGDDFVNIKNLEEIQAWAELNNLRLNKLDEKKYVISLMPSSLPERIDCKDWSIYLNLRLEANTSTNLKSYNVRAIKNCD